MNTPHLDERSYVSRAREFDSIFGCLSNPENLFNAIKSNPTNVDLELEGIRFECGNVNRLLPDIQVETANWPYSWKPVFVSHIDSVSAPRKKEIELNYCLPTGSLTSTQRKADLLFIDEAGKPYFISFKDTEKPCKLGQISKNEKYAKASLGGGHLVDLPNSLIPHEILWTDTAIPEIKFKSLGLRDRQFAYLKHKHPQDWRRIVEVSLEVAYSQLACFGLALEYDRESFLDFLGKTLSGNLRFSSDFYLALGAKSVNLASMLERLREGEINVTSKMVTTKTKKALIIETVFGDTTYGVTRIEPSFEGDGEKVRQTKGIIYHFQQFPNSGDHYIKLFLDVMK